MENNRTAVPQGKTAPHLSGMFMLVALFAALAACVALIILSAMLLDAGFGLVGGVLLALSILAACAVCIAFAGLKTLAPNQALVLTLFGRYYGTLDQPGFYYVHPFASANAPASMAAPVQEVVQTAAGTGAHKVTIPSKKISLKIRTLDNRRQKVNDALGNPIIIGSVALWRVADPTTAVFAVENFEEYLSIQCDSTIRNIARLYPYDTTENDLDEKTLRGSSSEVSEIMRQELAARVADAGLIIEDVRITHLAYADEIAAAMLQRQQATAIIAARQKIVEGAVSMVKMAIDQLGEEEIVVLDEERKAAMVSNLLVVLCGNKDAQPIVNSGSLY